MMNDNRILVIFSVMVLVLAPLVSTFPIVSSPINEAQIDEEPDVVGEVADILSKLKDEGIDFDESPLATEDIVLPFGGFIQNLGQISDNSIKYYYSSSSGSVGFGDSIIDFACVGPDDEFVTFSITFPGSHDVAPVGAEKKGHVVNFIRSDVQLSNVQTFDEIFYSGLYDGIDLRYYMSDKGLKYDFIIHPGSSPSDISLKVSDELSLSVEDESVSMYSHMNPEMMFFQDTGLDVFQKDGTRISTSFTTIDENTYGFSVDTYDNNQVLVIDPWFLAYSTFLGGSEADYGRAIVVGASGYSFITGLSYSSDFPTENEYQSDQYSIDAFIARLAPDCTPVFITYFGGDSFDFGNGIAIDHLARIYVCGQTMSDTGFPLYLAEQSTYGGGTYDGFVARFSSDGSSLSYSTYLGGSSDDIARDIAVDSSGQAYVTGKTLSSDFPMASPYNSTIGESYDAFVVKYLESGQTIKYSTFIGGNGEDTPSGIAVDSGGYCYIAGYTNGTYFPTHNAMNATSNGGYDVFVTRFNPNGFTLNFSTFIGSTGYDFCFDMALGSDGKCYITGRTHGTNYPTKSPYQTNQGGTDAFVTVVNEAGAGIYASTYLGGSAGETGLAIELGPHGKVHVTGWTESADFPVVNAYSPNYEANFDIFVTRFNADLDDIEFGTYLGTTSDDMVSSLDVDPSGHIYITGYTESASFPTVRGYQNRYGGGDQDAFVTKFAEDTADPVITLVSPEDGSTIRPDMTIDLDVTDDWFVDTVLYNWDGGNDISLSEPFDIPIPPEKTYILHVFANDSAGNEVTETYTFHRTTAWLPFSTFMGGSLGGGFDSAIDYGRAIALDDEGNCYFVGVTESTNFPLLNALNDTHSGRYDIFLSKLDLNGTLLFSTYIGGTWNDYVYDVELDSSGNIYLCGYTESDDDFPIVNAQNATFGGGNYDAFVMKVNNVGDTILFSTYLGGVVYDVANALELDELGNVYVVGCTYSPDFPTVNAFDDTIQLNGDGFLAKYSSDGQTLLYSSALGGDSIDQALDLALDSDGFCYIVGQTASTDFPTINAMNATKSGAYDIFITKMKPGEPGLNYSTYFGSAGDDQGQGITVDAAGTCYIIGWADFSNYPLKNEIQSHQGGRDIVVTAIDHTGNNVLFSTYLGSNVDDHGSDITLGPDGHVHIVGGAGEDGFPLENAYDSTFGGNAEVIIAKFNLVGDELEFCSYLGGAGDTSNSESGSEIAVHSDGTMVIVGSTSASDYPTVNAYQDTYAGGLYEAFIARIAFDVNKPVIDNPPDTVYQAGTTGNNITWTPDDDTPDSYRVFRNGSLVDEDDWDPEDDNITISVDGLAEGVYNFTIIVFDETGNNETSTIWVTVVNDEIWPTIDHPNNIFYDEFTTGNWLTWTPYDEYPSNYTIYRNGEVINDDPWSGDPVAILIDGLPYGWYNHTIVVWDIGGNWQRDIVWVNVFDGTPPSIDYPDAIIYDEGSTGHWLTWTPTDANPVSYEIFRNGTSLEPNAWDGSPIAVQIDGLSMGVYNYTLVVTDIDDNVRWRTTYVTVVDGTPPTIDSPDDMEYEEGATGNEITWTPSDLNPSSYEIILDGTSLITDDWTGGTLTISADGFVPGVYNFTVVVTDVGGHTASDSVIVTVTQASTTPTSTTTTSIVPTTPPEGVDIVIIIIMAGAGGAILIIIVYACKRKQGA